MRDDTMASARAFWVTGIETGELREEAIAPPATGEVLVETHYSGISRGTESLVFGGRVPDSEFERMRAPHQGGAFPFPVKYGYASVGRVVAGEPALAGRAVFCLYPHQTRYVVGADAVLPIPDDVPPARAVLAANMETAVNGLWDAKVRVGDRVTIVGGGAVGCLVAYLAARIPGCDVELVDLDPARAAVAAAFGARFALPADARPEVDLVVHASGSPQGLGTALGLAGREAIVLEMSWYGDRRVELALGASFHSQRLRLRSSQVGGIAPEQAARWTHRRRLALAVSLLRDSVLDTLVTEESAFEDLPATMAALAASPGAALCHRVRYPAAD